MDDQGAEICPRITITKITISEKEMHLQKEQECGEMSRKTKNVVIENGFLQEFCRQL